MQATDKLDLSNKNFLDLIVDHRRLLVAAIAGMTLILVLFIPNLKTDPGLESGVDKNSKYYRQNQELQRVFGNEEFILIGLKNESGVNSDRMLKALAAITAKIGKLNRIDEVISLSTLKLFQKKGKLFGNYPVVETEDGKLRLPDADQLAKMRRALPIMDYLVSPDLKTAGILVRMNDKFRFDIAAVTQLQEEADKILRDNIPPGTEFRIVGAALIRRAVVRHCIQTGIVFGVLCMLIATVVSAYVFRSLKVTAITNSILTICILWDLGLMAWFEIPLNPTTALSFGFIPITTAEIVIHMLVRYHMFHQTTRDKLGALKQAVRWLARPCFMCISTTAVGFGTLMVSSIPMVRQLGFIMSIGVLISYALSIVLTPFFFAWIKEMDIKRDRAAVRGWLDHSVSRLVRAIFAHHYLFVAVGLLITVFLLAGAPFIRSDPQILRMLGESTPEIQDIRFIERNLMEINSVELMLEGKPGDFKSPKVWKRLEVLDRRLKEIPDVVSTDSLLPLMKYLEGVIEGPTKDEQKLFSDSRKISELLTLIALSPEGKDLLGRYVNDSFDRYHISIRIRNSPSIPIGDTIKRIQTAAQSVMTGTVKCVVTGDLAMVAHEASGLISDQIHSMFLAGVIIAIIMVVQMESVVLGLISLIPNIPPVAAVFGIMGWFGIRLDAVTVFAASVAIGLAVDNTIHYLTQLKREIALNPASSIETCVGGAYELTARQISAWSTITMFGFLALVISPFRPVVFFGILGCCSIMLGLYGDLIFIQSLILSSPRIRKSIAMLMEREADERA